MKIAKWKKIDDMYIAECEGHMAQDRELVVATSKAVRKAYEEDRKNAKENVLQQTAMDN